MSRIYAKRIINTFFISTHQLHLHVLMPAAACQGEQAGLPQKSYITFLILKMKNP